MSTKFFTNEGDNTLLKKFAGVFEHNTDIVFFDALVGYFRASGYFSIRSYLDRVPHIRILVGINVDEIVAKYQSKGLLFKGDALMKIINKYPSDELDESLDEPVSVQQFANRTPEIIISESFAKGEP